MESYPVCIFKIHKKNKGRLNCWINQHRLNFSPANSLSWKEKQERKNFKKRKERKKKKNKKGKDDVWQECKMEVTESNRPLASLIQFWCKKTEKIKPLSFIKRSRTLRRVEKRGTHCCGLLQHQKDVWGSETRLNIFQCSFPSAFLAPNSSRLLTCLLLWLSLRADYVLEESIRRQRAQKGSPARRAERMLKAEITSVLTKSEEEKVIDSK